VQENSYQSSMITDTRLHAPYSCYSFRLKAEKNVIMITKNLSCSALTLLGTECVQGNNRIFGLLSNQAATSLDILLAKIKFHKTAANLQASKGPVIYYG